MTNNYRSMRTMAGEVLPPHILAIIVSDVDVDGKLLQDGALRNRMEKEMARVTYILEDGSRRDVDVQDGTSVMKAAREVGISGIEAECGGCMTCATCHVYVAPEWIDKLAEPSDEERIMIDCAIDVRPNSRLSCQISMSDALDGIVIEIPASQF